jgi:cobalt-zinc-cadmium resistance protein CzcA
MVWAGEFDNMKLAEQRLAVVVLISMLLILLLLYGLFNSWRDSLLALAGIPSRRAAASSPLLSAVSP